MTSAEKMQRYLDIVKQIDELATERAVLLKEVLIAESPFKRGDKITYRNGQPAIVDDCTGYITTKNGTPIFEVNSIYAYKLKQDGTSSKVKIRLSKTYDKVEKV